MSRFLLACDTLRRRYNCTILLVDFGGLGHKPGAMALKDAIDTEYRLERSGDKLTLTAIKMRNAILPDPLALKMHSVELPGLEDEYGNPVTSVAIEVLDALQVNQEGISKKRIRGIAGLNSAYVQTRK